MSTAALDLTAMDVQVDNSQVDTGDINPDLGEQTEGEVAGGQVTETPAVDGRRGPLNYRTAAKAALEAVAPEHQAAIKELTSKAFTADDYIKVFPKPADAQAAKTFIDTVGGIDGFGAIQQRLQGYDTQEAGLESGDPAVLDSFFTDYPEGAAALAPHYLDKLAKANPEAFNDTIAPHALGMLEKAGILNHVATMAAETDPARQKQMIGQLAEWMKQQKQAVGQMQTKPAVNPENSRLKEQQTKLQTQQDEFFQKQVDTEVNSKASGEVSKVVEQYAKSYKLNDVQKNRFATAVASCVVNEMLADDTFKKQDAIRKSAKTRDVANVASFRASEFLRRLPDVAFKEAQEWWGANKGVTQQTGVVKPGQAKTAPGGGPLLVSRAPEISELDMAKDPRQLLYIQNRGYRKDGTFVTWK